MEICILLFLHFVNQSHLTMEISKRKKVCLSMIVKNESKVIVRCLGSVKPYIDSWIIVDTGSTDGTQDIIRNFYEDVPGSVEERPWVDFAHNRNEALVLAKLKFPEADYILTIDADEVLLPYKNGATQEECAAAFRTY